MNGVRMRALLTCSAFMKEKSSSTFACVVSLSKPVLVFHSSLSNFFALMWRNRCPAPSGLFLWEPVNIILCCKACPDQHTHSRQDLFHSTHSVWMPVSLLATPIVTVGLKAEGTLLHAYSSKSLYSIWHMAGCSIKCLRGEIRLHSLEGNKPSGANTWDWISAPMLAVSMTLRSHWTPFVSSIFHYRGYQPLNSPLHS